ncbi:MAG: FAD-binding protein, partial [Muribaculaceae bacterium]|nr:FAD-binding protein [Muribaculaceae bacterium]
MLHKISIHTDPDIAYDPARLPATAALEIGVAESRVKRVDVLRRSIDARRRHVVVNLSLAVHIDTVDESECILKPTEFRPVPADAPQAVVVGAGPAGIFAALRLIELGVRPIVLE